MNISGVKTEQLSIGELLSASFSVWFTTIWKTFKLSIVFFIIALGAFFGSLLAYAYMPQLAAVSLAIVIFALSVLAFSFSVFVFTLFAEDGVNGVSSPVIESLARVYSSLHILLGAGILLALVFMVCFLPVLLFKNPLILLPTILLLFILYIIVMPFVSFFPMAVLLRGAGIIDSFKYSYYMVKGRWLRVVGWIFLVGIINMFGSLILNIGLKVFVSHLMPSSTSNLLASVVMGGGLYSLVFILLGFVFAMIFATLLFNSFGMSAMTVMFLNLEVVNTPPQDEDPYGDEEDIHGTALNVPEPSQQPHEITEMFKNIKAVDVNVATNTERRTALGRLNREEALRQFKKDDQITFPPLSAQPVVPPAPSAPSAVAQSVVNIPEDLPPAPPAPHDAAAEGGGMPTITVRQSLNKNHGFPSVYRPEDTK